MDFLVDRLHFLGLNDREVRVFTALSTFGRMNMTKIASRAGIARTTVDAIIRRLIEQGLVTQERIGNHYEYAVQLEKVADTLGWIENRLRHREIQDDNDEKIVKENKNDVPPTIEGAFKDRAGDRLRVLLARTQNGLEDALNRLTEYVHNAVVTNTKTEILACAQVADAIQRVGVGNMVLKDPNLIRLNVVPSAYCRADADILIFSDRVLVRDIRNGSIQIVHEAKTVEAMKHLLDIACETGWSVNLSAWLNEAPREV